MIPAHFDYRAPCSLADACQLLVSTPQSKILAGGMSLIPALKARLNTPDLVVDIGRIPELESVGKSWGKLQIGARTTHASLIDHPLLEAVGLPVFTETARVIADPQVRNRGTIGGSLVHADPSADWPALFLALDGEVKVLGPKGTRKIKASDFFLSMLTSSLHHDELLVEIIIPLPDKRSGSAYSKLRHAASGLAVVGAAAEVCLDRRGRIERLNLGISGVNTVPFLAHSVAARLRGQIPTPELLRNVCAHIDEADPMEDQFYPANYRRQLLALHACTAITRASVRAEAVAQ